jgi:hypothetical protein
MNYIDLLAVTDRFSLGFIREGVSKKNKQKRSI